MAYTILTPPPALAAGSYSANTATTLYTATGNGTMFPRNSISISNTSGTPANVQLWIADASNALQGYLEVSTPVSGGTSTSVALVISLPAGYKIRFQSDNTGVGFLATGGNV